jgi:3-deoxy-D-manno-octulosonate 8-phosphate phosphatase KdsC-like HAD superfamily phosphatase
MDIRVENGAWKYSFNYFEGLQYQFITHRVKTLKITDLFKNKMTKAVKHVNAVIEKLEIKVKLLQDMFDNLLDVKVRELEDRES